MPLVLIGLTGGIACGKSTVSSMLSDEYSIPIIDADRIVHELQGPRSPCTRRIAARWPECVDPATGELRREALGRIIFSDPAARRELGRIMNGPIFTAILKHIMGFWWRGLFTRERIVVVLDAPTLFETQLFTYLVSSTIVVACSEERQLQRLESRNGMHSEEAAARIRSQMPLESKRRLAGLVVENDAADDLPGLHRTVEAATGWMRRQSAHKITVLVVGAVAVVVGVAAGVGSALYCIIVGS